MKRTLVLAAVALALCIPNAGFAQYPDNGYIGVFSDLTRTNCCATIPALGQSSLEIFAVLRGGTSGGITGAEFRLIFTNPTGYVLTWVADPAANLVIGSPVDPTPTDPTNDPYGVNEAFPSCQGTMAGDAVHLGSINVFNINGGGGEVVVTRKLTPTNPNVDCPALILCDAPTYTQLCLTVQTGTLPPGQEPIIFRAGLNKVDCDANFCGPIPVTAKTWSGMKELYR
jgi:hypothetical protein